MGLVGGFVPGEACSTDYWCMVQHSLPSRAAGKIGGVFSRLEWPGMRQNRSLVQANGTWLRAWVAAVAVCGRGSWSWVVATAGAGARRGFAAAVCLHVCPVAPINPIPCGSEPGALPQPVTAPIQNMFRKEGTPCVQLQAWRPPQLSRLRTPIEIIASR